MTHYTVEMKGNWTRAWPNQAISLLDCVFQGDESVSKGFFQVSTEIEEKNDEDARLQGRQRIEEACYLFELCLEGFMQLVPNQVTITKRGGVSEVAISAELRATVYSPTPPTPDDLQRLDAIQNKIKQSDCLRRVIRWWGEARRETEPIDRFIKLWVAFEVLTKGQSKGEHFSKVAKNCLKKLYQGHNAEKIEQLVNDLQNTRNKVFLHEGKWELATAQKQGSILEAIFEDLLIDYLDLPRKLQAKEFLT